ncbi:unnamed protein product [Staurois parvus]|uniref:Uncharacterized protein n=1 Tax=Staurois parvus TaxID=386267 RepID=A0ABN9EK58_9NEOB|nr:unnamed protein product [Staurois parvus]
MQTASTNIGERLCNKSIRDISWLLNIPRSTVSGIIKVEATGNNSNSATKWEATSHDRAGSVHAEAHSVQKSPTVCRVNS